MTRTIVLVALSCLSGWATTAHAEDLRIEHVAIVSAERATAIRDATVFIHEARIMAILSGAQPGASPDTPSTGKVIDGRGLYLTPGLIDSHVHLAPIPGMNEQQELSHPDLAEVAREQIPRSYLYFGFTTLVDLDPGGAGLTHWKSTDAAPDAYFCGSAAVLDGYPMQFVSRPERYHAYPYFVVQSGEEAAVPQGIDPAAHTPIAVVAHMKANGALCVKAFFQRNEGENIPALRLDTLKALVQAAHSAGLPVFLHATGLEGHKLGLDAGVDVLAHGLWDWTGDPTSSSRLARGVSASLDRVMTTHTWVQPTMGVSYAFRDLFDPTYLSSPMAARVFPPALLDWYRSPEGQWFHDRVAPGLLSKSLLDSADASAIWRSVQSTYQATNARSEETTRYLARHNARLLFGTDTPAVPSYANPPGLNGWLEIHRLAAAGLTAAQIFRMTTQSNAEALGLNREIGAVQVGKRANLLLLRKDPTKTIDAYDDIVKVILAGRVLDRSDLAAKRGL